jgi:hypothetical protein
MGAEIIRLMAGAILGGKKIPEGAELRLDGGALFYQGEKLELGLTTADVHDPSELPTYLAGYSNEEFRWAEMCQPILVEKDEDKYRTFNTAAAFRPVKVKTDDDAYAAEVKVESSLTNYKVQPRRLAAFVNDSVAAQANANYDVKLVHMERCARAINMDLELDVCGPAGLLTTLANYGGSSIALNAGAGFQWGGPSGVGINSNPVQVVRDRVIASKQRITRWWFNQRVAGYFLDHPATRDYFRFQMGDSALSSTIKAVADMDGEDTLDFAIIGLGRFSVCSARYEDTTGNIDFIMPDCLLGVTQPKGTPTNGEKIATSYCFRRRGPNGNGFNTREVRIEQRGVGGTLVIAEEASVPTLTSTLAGAFVGLLVQ